MRADQDCSSRSPRCRPAPLNARRWKSRCSVWRLRAVAGGGASIIGLATPPAEPDRPEPDLDAVVIGLLIGLAIAFALVFLLESLDRRIKSIEEFEREYRLPVLAAVPQSAFRCAPRGGAHGELLEPYRILRSALDFAAVTRQLDTLLVTSAVSGEGKTTVAVDLAHAVALTGRRTVLIELDLRRPTFAEHFDLEARPRADDGADRRRAALGAARRAASRIVPNLLVLPSGRLPHNPSELLGSPRIAEIISELAADEGMVIIDAPPLNPVADAQVLLNSRRSTPRSSSARVDQTKRDEVRRARAILDRHIVEPVGIVVTGVRDAGPLWLQLLPRRPAPTLDGDVGAPSAELKGSERSTAASLRECG